MAGEQDKQVKLSFAVDEASVQRAKRAMQDLITDAQKLAEVLKQTNIGGMGGGGGGGTSLLGGGGVYSSPQNNQQVMAQQSVAPGQRITNALAENSQALKGLAQGSSDALRTMADALKRSVGEQERTVEGLQRKLAGLLETYGKLGAARGIGPLTEEDMRTAQDPLYRRRQEIALADQIETTSKEADTQGRRLANLQESHQAITGGSGQALVDPKAPNKPDLAAGLKWGAVALGAQGLLNTGANIAGSIAGAAELQPGRMAARGQVFGDMYQRAYGGDWTVGAVMGALGGDPRFGGKGWATDATSLANSDISAMMATGGRAAAGLVPGVNLLTGGYNPITGVADAAFLEQDAKTMELQNYRKLAADYEASAGVPIETAIRKFQGDMGRNIGLERSLGFGGTTTRHGTTAELKAGHKDLSGQGFGGMDMRGMDTVEYKDKLADLTYQLATHGGYMTEEYAAAVEPLRRALGTKGAYAGGLASLVMGGEAGGFMGIGGIAAQAGIGGSAPELLRSIFGMGGGKNGMSQAAAMGIGGTIAGGLTGGGIATSGLGMMAAIQAGMGTGGGGAADLMIAQQVQGGIGAFGNIFSGAKDNYTAGMNFLNAGASFGNTGFAAQGYLSTIFGKNPDLAADIISGRVPIPPELKAAGVTSKEQVASFVGKGLKQQIGLAASYVSSETPAGKRLQEVMTQAGGDIQAYMKMNHISAHSAAGKQLREQVGTGLAMAGIASDAAAGIGLVGVDMGLGAHDLKTGGAGAPQSAARKAIAEDADRNLKNSKDIATSMGAILTAVSNTKNAIDPLKGIVTDMTQDAASFDDALKLLTVSVLEAAGKMNPDLKSTAEAALKEFNKRHAPVKAAPVGNTIFSPGHITHGRGG